MLCTYKNQVGMCFYQGEASLKVKDMCAGVAYGIDIRKCDRFECPGFEIERGRFSGCDQDGDDCPNCGG